MAKKKRTSVVGLMDSDGVIHHGIGVLKQQRFIYVFEGEYMLQHQGVLLKIASLADLGEEALRVYLALMGSVEYNNEVIILHKEIAAKINISASNFSRALKKLISLGIIYKVESRGTIVVNPKLAWKGSAKSHQQAITLLKTDKTIDAATSEFLCGTKGYKHEDIRLPNLEISPNA